MNNYRCIMAALAALLVTGTPATAAKTCSARDSDAADRVAIDDWQGAYRWWKRYAACDDGGVGETVSGSITTILAHKWRTLPALDALAARDPTFRTFVVSHVDSTADEDDLAVIKKNAASCAAKLAPLCATIRKRAIAALKDMGG